MSAYWTARAMPIRCGYSEAPHWIPAGDPVRVIGAAVIRCAAHTPAPVDWAAVDAANHTLEVERLSRATPPTAPATSMTRYRRPRQVTAFTALADLGRDPKTKAAGD